MPFTFTRPVAEIRTGILTITEKWAKRTQTTPSHLTPPYLAGKYPSHYAAVNTYVNGSLCPTEALVNAVGQLEPGESLVHGMKLLAYKSTEALTDVTDIYNGASIKPLSYSDPVTLILNTWDIFAQNRAELIADFALLTAGRVSQPITDPATVVYGREQVFLEPGVQLRAAILNAETGPIYLGKNAVVGEGSIIRGAFALGQEATLNMGAKMRGDTTIGPYCKVGGEISNSVFFSHSNKGHEGYVGNTVVGEWCNFGADSNTSNLKNNYSNVKLWNYRLNDFIDTERQFCGLMMGDHVKCSINTMFNTGTVVGVGGNLFGTGFPPKVVPSFAWGGSEGFTTFQLPKFIELAYKVMMRRSNGPTSEDLAILGHVYDQTQAQRTWE